MGIFSQLGQMVTGNAPLIGDPVAMNALRTSMGLGTFATGVNALGNIFSGVGGYQESTMRARILDQGAQSALTAGQEAESALKMKYGTAISEQAATTASRGVVVGGGSAQAIQETKRSFGALDTALQRYNTAREVYGYETEASLQRQAGRNMLVKGLADAGTTLVGGAYGLSDKWLAAKGAFTPGPMTLSSPEVVANKPISADTSSPLGTGVPKNFPYNDPSLMMGA